MPAITTAELVERAKAAADMHDNFVTPRQWMYWASQERMALDLFIARHGWSLAFDTLTVTVTGSEDNTFELETDDDVGIMAIVAVHEVATEGVRRLLPADPASFIRAEARATGNSREYRVKRSGDTLILNLYPEPSSGETYLVTYVPHTQRLTLDAAPAAGYENEVSYPMGWEERIILGMARRALDKEEADSTAIQRQIAEMNQQIEELCWERVMSEAPTIQNSDAHRRGWYDRLTYPPAVNWWWA
jgi:hypothetical protein